jgi:hypothetical protein
MIDSLLGLCWADLSKPGRVLNAIYQAWNPQRHDPALGDTISAQVFFTRMRP